jgi:hypothetical protein
VIEVGLWVKTDQEEIVIKRDAGGHPDLAPLSDPQPFVDREAKKEKIRSFYQQLTGRPHPHPHAATRQLLWDFIEVALKRLP